MYDLGWGKENGYYKEPLLGFDALLDLVLHSENNEDMYGAAAVILDQFADNLLCQCEIYMNDRHRKKDFEKFVKVFNLKSSTNRCSIVGKTYEQIQSDYARWKIVSELATKL